MSLLVLCTGNLCRSPMAEAMFRERATACGAPLRVQSAGFATEGQPPPQATLLAAQGLGLDLSSHRSRLITADMLAASDLIIGMTRSHIWDAALLNSEIVPRAFVIGELARLNREIGSRRVGEPFSAWLDRLHSHRTQTSRPSGGDEIPDPYGRRRAAHEKVARRLHSLVMELGDCAFEPLQTLSERRWQEGRLIWRLSEDGERPTSV